MDEEGTISCLVGWTDADGQDQQRWFTEGQLASA
jgi:hypothetical protein